MTLSKEVEAGQAVYTRLTLAVYDFWVLGVSNRFFWKCPTPRLLDLYRQHVTANHLDVGVGAGYFLDRCRFPDRRPRLALMDLNPNSLEAASRRVARYGPAMYRRNVLDPIDFDDPGFDSIGINYLLHCLPGALPAKAGLVFERLKPLLNPNGVVFGATLLGEGVERNAIARRLMDLYNEKGIFSNKNDNLPDLQQALQAHFAESAVHVVGCAALFWGRAARVRQ